MNSTFEEIKGLSVPEKIQLVEDLWGSIAKSNATLPVLDWQSEELARRKESHLKNPNAGLSWDQVKKSALSFDDFPDR